MSACSIADQPAWDNKADGATGVGDVASGTKLQRTFATSVNEDVTGVAALINL